MISMKNIRRLALSLALFGVGATISAQSTFDVVLQNDGGNTLISLSCLGDVLTSVAATDDATWSGVSGTFTNYLNGGSQSSSLTGFGVFYDLTTGDSATINSVQFINDSGTLRLAFFFDTNITVSEGDEIQYVPATDSETISVAISSFNPGTYDWNNTSDPYTSGPFDYNMDLTVVPEPSMFALAGLGGLALLLFRRRKS
jgi:hypothetical protein